MAATMVMREVRREATKITARVRTVPAVKAATSVEAFSEKENVQSKSDPAYAAKTSPNRAATSRPATAPIAVPTTPAHRLYIAPSVTERPTSRPRLRPSARSTPSRDRRSCASIPMRLTISTAPTATTRALIPMSMARNKSEPPSALSISWALASRTSSGTCEPSVPTARSTTGAARCPAATLSRIPPGAEIRTMLIRSVPAIRCAVLSGANTTEPSVYPPGPCGRVIPATRRSTGGAPAGRVVSTLTWIRSPVLAPSLAASTRDSSTLPGERSRPKVRLPSVRT
jgi:hypothetical protein